MLIFVSLGAGLFQNLGTILSSASSTLSMSSIAVANSGVWVSQDATLSSVAFINTGNLTLSGKTLSISAGSFTQARVFGV